MSVPGRILLACICATWSAYAAQTLPEVRLDRGGSLMWTSAVAPGVCTVQQAGSPAGPWWPLGNFYCTNGPSSGAMTVGVSGDPSFFRAKAVSIEPTPQGFINLVYSYGILETIAGAGVGQLDVNYWQSYYEGGPAAYAALSRPHFAMADRAGNVYIADKNSHSILRVSPQGAITTFAGTHAGRFNGEGPAAATTLQLNLPNGEWVRSDGTVYVLDTDNGRLRRVDTNGVMVTLFMATTTAPH